MNQMQVNGVTRLVSEQLRINGIELYSKFDGNYALQFLNVFFTCDSNEICKTNFQSKPIEEFQTRAALFSGSKNGFFQAYHRGRYRAFYWLVHPYLEINNGIYYSDKEQSFLDQKMVDNSSYQNISGRIEFGIKNERSFLLFDSHLSFANLYKPINLLDTIKIKHKFSNYNNLLTQIKFSNSFSEFLKLTGNIYLKNFLRDYSTMIDSTIFSFDIYNNEFEIEEFNYGINTIIEYDSRWLNKPTLISLSYSQDLFLVNSNYLKGRARIESENLKVGIEQTLDYSNKGHIKFSVNSIARAMLYSSLGDLPKNITAFDVEINNSYPIDSNFTITNSISRKAFFPFIGYYHNISEAYLSNLDLQNENWYQLNNELLLMINKNLNIKPFLNFYLGNNVIVFNPNSRRYINNGTSKGLEIGLAGQYRINNIIFKFDGCYNLQNVSENNILMSNFLRMPLYGLNINFYHNFYEFIETELNLKLLGGLHSINQINQNIEKIPSNYTLNLMIQKKYDNAFFTLILRNLTNRYNETNIGIPDRGISFLLGTAINF